MLKRSGRCRPPQPPPMELLFLPWPVRLGRAQTAKVTETGLLPSGTHFRLSSTWQPKLCLVLKYFCNLVPVITTLHLQVEGFNFFIFFTEFAMLAISQRRPLLKVVRGYRGGLLLQVALTPVTPLLTMNTLCQCLQIHDLACNLQSSMRMFLALESEKSMCHTHEHCTWHRTDLFKVWMNVILLDAWEVVCCWVTDELFSRLAPVLLFSC